MVLRCTYDAVEKDFETKRGLADIYIQDLVAQLCAKDEEIESLNCRVYHAEGISLIYTMNIRNIKSF